MTTKYNLLFLKIEDFYLKLQAGVYDHPHNLARALEVLTDLAWDEVDEIYPPSLRIDP